MPIYARCDRCKRRLQPGTKCDCMKRLQCNEKKTRGEYGTARWKIKRAAILEQYHFMDALVFYQTGTIVPAEMVHHIEPLQDAPELWLRDENLIPLSNRSHALVEAAYDDPATRQEMQRVLRAAMGHFRAVFHLENASRVE